MIKPLIESKQENKANPSVLYLKISQLLTTFSLKNRKLLILFLVFIFSYLFALNYYLIPISDDLYHVTAGNTSISDCIERYMTFTSRFFEMILVLLIKFVNF